MALYSADVFGMRGSGHVHDSKGLRRALDDTTEIKQRAGEQAGNTESNAYPDRPSPR